MNMQPTTTLHLETFPFFNISLHLNQIKPISLLNVENSSDTDLQHLDLTINSDVPFLAPFCHHIEVLPAQTIMEVPLADLSVNRAFLAQLSETEQAQLSVLLKQGSEVLAEHRFSLNVQPLEHFGGFHILPQLIAAYITPNHPYVYHLKRKAIEILQSQQLRPAFEGYQSHDPERVLQLMSALYSAIRSEGIIYSALPPGYETGGQRLRLLNTIQQQKFANCIDISLLFAACLEAVDLNPILIVVRGHAFIGCWLHDDKFAEMVNDDKSAITKRLAQGIREIAAVEATLLCEGSRAAFSDALNMGEAQLVQQEDFLVSIDIKAARAAQIRPLPLLHDAAEIRLDETSAAEPVNLEKQFEIGEIYQDELLQSRQPATKQKIWERKLLDLSLRNSLLNVRLSRNMLQLADIDIHHLEDTLSDGKSFAIVPNPQAEVLKRYNVFTQPLHRSSPVYQMANDELKYQRLLTFYHQQDLDHILAHIHKNARQALEENGSSTLYLAVGLLKWFDRKTPDQARYAPVLLIPVEISRRSVNSRFMLKSREEETMVNITLIEFLRQEYELDLSGLEVLPTDDKGVDVAKVMGILRRAVMQLKGWDINEQVILGNFSFSKLILWKDMVSHQDALMRSPMVKSLIEGKLAFADAEPDVPVDFEALPSQSLTLPIATDVSQLQAVYAAQQGRSFILHGPPGTGKSQTITNIIADALARGKRVLFVAAKKAALDVVHHRLTQIGLAPFTLELHSNKSKKSDVLSQLAASLESARIAPANRFEQEAARLDAAKKELSSYVEALHRPQPAGWSLYESIVQLQAFSDVPFSQDWLPETVWPYLDAGLWQQWTDWLPQFAAVAQNTAHPDANPLAVLGISSYTPALEERIAEATSAMQQCLADTIAQTDAMAAALHFPLPVNTEAQWNRFIGLLGLLTQAPDLPTALGLYAAEPLQQPVYREWQQNLSDCQALQTAISSSFKHTVFTLDLNALEQQWQQAGQSWFLPRWLNQRRIRQQLSGCRDSKITDDAEISRLFEQAAELQNKQQRLQHPRFDALKQALGALDKDMQTDMADVETQMQFAGRLNELCNAWSANGLSQWLQNLAAQHIHSFNTLLSACRDMLHRFIQQAQTYQTQQQSYQTLTQIHFDTDEAWLHKQQAQLAALLPHLPGLRNWLLYRQFCRRAEALQLNWLVAAFEQKKYTIGQMADYCHYTTHRSLVRRVIEQHEPLALFNVSLFESKIAQYKKMADDYRHLSIRQLQASLSAKLPNSTIEAMQSSEIGILQRAIKSRGRGTSIRRLFDQIPVLLPRIAPCMLMSPISVAQYFDADPKHFDLLIFDEASQLPTCEAVSALARAKQAIIVGDPKQMPPTSFFTSIKTDEENIELEDLESILDDCLSLSVPSKYLLRHYRSKHESLIAFSNAHYYDNKLLTFPSADDLNRKVSYHPVHGFYDKGKTRTNAFEAEAVVQHICRHFADTDTRRLSLGVVTFSQTQQSLIEERLQQVFAENTALEQWATESNEALFVKNLENVQGDERDIILFSVGYGPDEQGKVSMNFGPLNRNGGWRRLNVAVTRARYAMHIFATLKSEQIDLARTASQGVAGLKAFLDFAEKGRLAVQQNSIVGHSERRFLAESIALRLQAHGLATRCHIGTSDFKVDLAVVHPDKPQEYILAVLIDGRYYHAAQTTNDREMVMPSVLEMLGWQIHRVWSIDWLANADRIISQIVDKVHDLQQQVPQIVSVPEAPEETAAEPLVLEMPDNTHAEPLLITAAPSPTTKQKPYQAHTLTAPADADSDTVYLAENRRLLLQQLRDVVQTESPISRNLLYRKVTQAWNIARIGNRLSQYLDGIMQESGLPQTHHHQPFYWQTQPTAQLYEYRQNDVEKRAIDDIAPEEILAALHDIMQHSLSLDEDELIRGLAKTFSFAKVGKQIDNQLRYAVHMAEQSGNIQRGNGRIQLVSSS